MRRIVVIVGVALATAACGTTQGVSEGSSAAGDTISGGIQGAATAPLEDFNLIGEEVPEPIAAVVYPYTAPRKTDCEDIAAELEALRPHLGIDYDEIGEDESLAERGGEAAGDLVVDTVRDTTTGFIPFRGLVRQATGAAKRDREIRAAYQRALARRAFLRGLAVGLQCDPPAAPSRISPIEDAETEAQVSQTLPESARTMARNVSKRASDMAKRMPFIND